MIGTIEKYNSPVADNVKKIIDDRCLKQSAVATKAGYSIQAFNDMLNGRRIIKVMDIQVIANTLEVDANVLLGMRNKKEVG